MWPMLPSFIQLASEKPPETPVTIQAALLTIALAVGAASPFLLKSLNSLIVAYVRRINVGSDKSQEEIQVLNVLQDEVKQLRQDRTEDRAKIQALTEQIASLRHEWDIKEARYQASITELTQKNNALHEENTALRTENNQLRARQSS